MSDARATPASSQPVEDYLDTLLLTLSAPPREVRRTLAEVEAHLHDAVAEEMAAGKSGPDAEAAAVARLGAVHELAGRPVGFSTPTAALLRRTALAGSLIGGVALVALGVSGAVAWALAGVRGGTFLVAPFPPGSYTSADCAHWLTGDPGTHSCLAAMMSDHVGDVIVDSLAGGVIGLLVLTAHWRMRRRWQDRGTLTALPVGGAEAVGAILALLVAVITLGRGVNIELVQLGQGAGQMFATFVGALAAAAFFAVRLFRLARPRAGRSDAPLLPGWARPRSAVARPPTD
jgi:hypothetical protein